MKKAIREDVFETNSSAVHSLVIAKEGLEPSNLPVDKDGYIVADFGNYGEYDMGYTTFSQEDKLAYLATECFYLNRWDKDLSDFYVWKNICEAVCKYAGVKGIKLKNKIEPELNHQEIPEYDLKFCNAWDEDSIINFIFNKYAGIEMSHD